MVADQETVAQPAGDVSVRRRPSTVADLLRSLAVLLGVVGLIVVLVPRPSAIPQPPFDVASAARAATGLSFSPVVPSGLPAGWRATGASVAAAPDGLPTWRVTYVTPSAAFAQVEQAAAVTPAWLAARTGGGAPIGAVAVPGVPSGTWSQWRPPGGGPSCLVRQSGGVTTVISGTAAAQELRTLAAVSH